MISLNDSDREEFLYLQKHLILFTNKKLSIYSKFKTLDDLNLKQQKDIQEGIMPIREEMYRSDNINEFCAKNSLLTSKQVEILESWRLVYSDDFFVIKHLKNETILITRKEDKLYGVVGISSGLDEFFPSETLPILINTKLLPFKDKIVYDGFFGYHNIHFGRNIAGNLIHEYNKIKNIQGIISSPKANILLSDIDTSKDETEIIGYYVKQSLKEGLFPEDAWRLAKKSDRNRLAFEQEYAKYFSRHEKSSRKQCTEMKVMHYAMYRSCVVGVAETKKSLLEFCNKHYSNIEQYLHIFKA